MEYDPRDTTFLIQGLLAAEHRGPYPELPWKLGLIRRAPAGWVEPSAPSDSPPNRGSLREPGE